MLILKTLIFRFLPLFLLGHGHYLCNNRTRMLRRTLIIIIMVVVIMVVVIYGIGWLNLGGSEDSCESFFCTSMSE